MAEEIGSKPIDVQTLENIDSFDDLPDVTELTEEQLYAIRSGDLASDYIAPFEWDGESYEQWRSIIDGINIAIFDSVVDNFEPDDGDTSGPYADGEDLSTYYSEMGNGLNEWERTSNGIIGNIAAERVNDGNEPVIWSTPNDGLPNYPSAGDTVRYLIYTAQAQSFVALNVEENEVDPGGFLITHYTDKSISFGTRDSINHAGTEVLDVDVGDGIELDTWYWVEVELPTSTSDDIVIELFETDGESRGDLIETGIFDESDTSLDWDNYIDQGGFGFGNYSSSGTGDRLDGFEI